MSVSLQLRIGGREGAFGVGRVHRRHAESKSEEDRPQPTLKCSLFVLFLMFFFFPFLLIEPHFPFAPPPLLLIYPPHPSPPSLFLRERKEGGKKKKEFLALVPTPLPTHWLWKWCSEGNIT